MTQADFLDHEDIQFLLGTSKKAAISVMRRYGGPLTLETFWSGATEILLPSELESIDLIDMAMRMRLMASRYVRNVYFVQSGDSGPVKIGIAYNVVGRIMELQTANPDELSVQLVLPGDLEHERIFHARFAALRKRGEWFRNEGALREFLDRMIMYLGERRLAFISERRGMA